MERLCQQHVRCLLADAMRSIIVANLLSCQTCNHRVTCIMCDATAANDL